MFYYALCQSVRQLNFTHGKFNTYHVDVAPRWLFQQDRTEEATQILRLLQTHKGVVDEETLSVTITEILEALEMEKKQAGWKDLLKEDAVCSRRRVLLACLLNSCQAWSGSTPISYYTTVM